jgi:hypothetical protein
MARTLGLRRCLPAAIAAATLASGAGAAHAQTSKEQCRSAYEEGQLLRRESKPRASKERLAVCARAECPDLVRTDCIRWLDEVEHSIPTIVLEAHTESGDAEAVHVTMDGAPLTEHIDGRPIEVDPGRHAFRFELPDRPPYEVTLVIVEGQKDRPVVATWAAPAPAAPAPPPPVAPPVAPAAAPEAPAETVRPVPTAAWIAGGVGLAGLAGFTAFALVGAAKKNDLDASCAPFCTSSDVAPVRTAFAVADVSLGVGVVALSVAATLFLTRPAQPRRAPVVELRQGGAVLGWTERF